VNVEAAGAASGRPLGVIAGAGRFPHLVVEGARRAGCRVVVAAISGLADATLAEKADQFRWVGIARLGGWIRYFRRAGVARAILAGSVPKADMYGRLRLLRHWPDWTAVRLWFFSSLSDKRNDTVLRAVAERMADRGIALEDSVQYCADSMAPAGVWTTRQPTDAQWADVRFGWRIAREMGRLDVGQSVAVKETEVIAVEAIEGTDRMIERAGALCRSGGWTLVKVAKPNQDMRFDVPTVGVGTVDNLAAHGGRVLVVEAGKTLAIDRDQMIAAAERRKIVIVGLADEQGDPPSETSPERKRGDDLD